MLLAVRVRLVRGPLYLFYTVPHFNASFRNLYKLYLNRLVYFL